MNQMIVVPPQPASPPLPTKLVSFSGDRAEFSQLVRRGALLELVTVGFYRFWLATDIRRHLWSNTAIDGDAAEYTGRGRELLIGFLFALAILVPIYLAYFLIGLEVERFKAFASFPLFLFFYLFGQFAIYRARRYRLTRTVWRGVRFWMDGSGWAYAGRAALWGLMMIPTLGLILPWREAALERYKMQHCHYGDLQGSFAGTGKEFFKRGWWLWLLVVAVIFGIAMFPAVAVKFRAYPVAKFAPLVSLAGFVSLPFIYGAFKAVEWRWWISGIRFGEVRFEASLARGALIGLYWKVIGWFVLIAVSFGGYLFASACIIARISHVPVAQLFTQGNLHGGIPMLVLSGVGYLAFILVMNVVLRVYLLRDLWERLANSTTVHQIEAIDSVSARGDLASALGEGFADGLDIVGF
ncbi:MAG: DUF898 family protein [Bradyrhizobium sp.]|uniref:DUF898 family protein n=1 Tax=Bradyrhizobium sp. TaxID=376 RepID=UPI001C296CDD|nr:DUF898 family protein [Bradyrhizobium sp.]MBU6464138.1 DUF898 family protein [Pseudomonadota bacterium]MDE2068472.1 DUF898 family protein [Bradyrhizobium sp.]MDE2243124.1 DUF898 family protein [Bradyrhizobium sp.]MDE2468923.1 DUF898 family protein [Bradyrhizobium sp.]